MKSYWLALLLLPISLWSWNAEGHRTVAEIADHHITATTKKKVTTILGEQSMMEVASWADKIKRSNRKYNSWHYASLEAPTAPVNESRKLGRLYYGLTTCQNNLNDPTLDPESQATYLKLLIHLVGDAHQPLHVGNGLDKGGNRCWVRWFKRKRSYPLHTVWDSFLTRHALGKGDIMAADRALDHDTIAVWQSASIATWLAESRSLHQKLYPKPPIADRPYCQNDTYPWIPIKYQPHLEQDYANQMAPIVEKRLLQAGVRLAGVLNQLFDRK